MYQQNYVHCDLGETSSGAYYPCPICGGWVLCGSLHQCEYPAGSLPLYPTKQYPHRCPVCEGRGTVPHGFYSHEEMGTDASTAPETCRTCNGQGVIWG